MAMSKVRMGEIALALLMAKMEAEGGIKIGSDLPRRLGQMSKDTGIPRDELEEFSKDILVTFIGKAYNKRHISLTMNNERPDRQ